MKVKDGFVLRRVVNTSVVLPVGETTVNFNGMLTLNETGVFLWKFLEEGTTLAALADALVTEYGIGAEQATQDAEEFVRGLAEAGCIEL